VTCLGYATLTGLAWTIGISGGDLINNLSTQVLNFVSVPIALLLVAADSVARPAVSRWNDQRAGLPSAEWDWLGVDARIDHGRQFEDLHRGFVDLDRGVVCAMFLLAMGWSSMLGWLSKSRLPWGTLAIGHIRFHKSRSSRAAVTFARCRVLSACRTSEVSNRFVVEVPHRVHRRLRPVHLKDPLMKVARCLARYGAIALGHELAAAAARPMAVKHGPDRVVVLKLTWTISRVACPRITTCKNSRTPTGHEKTLPRDDLLTDAERDSLWVGQPHHRHRLS
jgi:hypothetical protein